jgi:mxaA protein
MKPPLWLLGAMAPLAALATFGAGEVAVPQRIDAPEPRAFGYQVGDTLQRRVAVLAPGGWRLDADSLPRVGGQGRAIELRSVATSNSRSGDGVRHELLLAYQVFLAPPAARTLELPAFRLRFDGAARTAEVLIDAWPVTVAPLVPAEVSPRAGLGEMQPDRAPPLIDIAALRARLWAIATLAALLLAALAVVYFGLPWRAAQRQPFRRAWRALRGLPAQPDAAAWRGACRQLHEALNRSAGEVVFEQGLDRFVAARPAFASLREDLARFLQLSRQAFFAEAAQAPNDAAWLIALCRRCRDAERGLL